VELVGSVQELPATITGSVPDSDQSVLLEAVDELGPGRSVVNTREGARFSLGERFAFPIGEINAEEK
jgi:hypothetical protein